MEIKSYRDLVVWQEAMTLVTQVYGMTRAFPKSEIFALTSQLQRAAVSVPANIAEGNGRQSRLEYLHHLAIARGSLAELDTLLILAQRLGYIQHQQLDALTSQVITVGRLLNALIRSLSRPPA